MAEPLKLTVESVGNHVYFYSEIDSDRSLDLIKELHEIDNDLTIERTNRRLPDSFPNVPIWLHLQSPGGGAFESFNVADKIGQLRSPVYCTIDGLCASGATFISQVCAKRIMQSNAMLMIHQLSSFAWGTHEQFKDELAVQKKLMKRMIDIYANRCSLTRKEIKEMMKRNTWLTADEALKSGFVDEII